jgi:hypothetical protein
MKGAIASCFCSSRANKMAVQVTPFFVTLCAAALFYACGAAAAKISVSSRAGMPAPSAPRGIKIDANESALDLKRTEALVATYLCPIADYLAEITRKPMTPRDRFLIVWAKDREEYYVQCLFYDGDRQIRCEGASGYYYDEIKGFLTEEKGEALVELGFSTDASAGNFARDLRIDEHGTRAIAKLIIELLARVYDLGPSDRLEYYAPLLSSNKGNPVIVDSERCPTPTSSLRRAFALSAILAGHP